MFVALHLLVVSVVLKFYYVKLSVSLIVSRFPTHRPEVKTKLLLKSTKMVHIVKE